MMSYAAVRVPVLHSRLVSWRVGDHGRYHVRNRATGETFRFGSEEHFLLSCCDGRTTRSEICRAYRDKFGKQLSESEFDEFLELANRSGLLQNSFPIGHRGATPTFLAGLDQAPSRPLTTGLWKRIASRTLQVGSTVLQSPAHILSGAASRLDGVRLRRLDFVPRTDDVFIVTYPRSGTTWMQMILYQLTTDGSMDFPHIAEYCPWFERSVRSARAFDTRPSPRLFKSHLPYAKIPQGPCKYVYVARDGKDVAVSCYHLHRMYNGFEGTFGDFFELFVNGKLGFGSWFQHVKGWWKLRHDPRVLFLTYEELSRDLEGCIRRIAAFIGCARSATEMDRIVQRSSFSFMKQYEQQFDPALEMLWEDGVGLKSFLRNGKVGDGAACLDCDQRAWFDEMYEQLLGPLNISWGNKPAANES